MLVRRAVGASERVRPRSRFVGVPDVGHVPHLEAPSAFSTAVLEFLR